MDELIRLDNITKIYNQDHIVLKDLMFSCNKGDFISIVGKSGSGKTTLVNIIGQLDTNYKGTYYYKGKEVENNCLIGNAISFIFQNYNLIDRFTVYENITLPYVYKNQDLNRQMIEDIMLELDIHNLRNQKINTISGGEKQRVAIARSIIMSSDLIIADEPTGNLDKNNAYVVMDMFTKMVSNGMTIILITHDENLTNFTDRVYFLENGVLHEKI